MKNISNFEELMAQKQDMVQIEQGLSGIVYRFTATNQEVIALKVMQIPKNQNEQTMIDKLNMETNFLKNNPHENLVKVYFGFCYSTLINKQYILGMEYIEKNMLTLIENKILKKEKFTNQEFFQYAYQLSQPLEFLQEKKIAHQDIKPQNILITEDNKLKLCDFSGFHIDNEAYKSILKSSGTGSLIYIAPEICNTLEVERIPIKCDVFSYGITMLQLYLCFEASQMKFFNQPNGETYLEKIFVQYNFADEEKYFFRKCLNYNPFERFDFHNIKLYLSQKLKNDDSFMIDQKLQKIKNTIKAQQSQILSLEDQVANFDSKYFVLQQKLNDLFQLNQELAQKLSDETIAKIIQENIQFKKELQITNKKIITLEDIHQKLQSNYLALEQKSQIQQSQINKLQNELSDFNQGKQLNNAPSQKIKNPEQKKWSQILFQMEAEEEAEDDIWHKKIQGETCPRCGKSDRVQYYYATLSDRECKNCFHTWMCKDLQDSFFNNQKVAK